MTDKQKRFADEYLVDCNATRAYKAAYPNCKKDSSADACARKLLGNTRIRMYIDEQLEKISSEKIADATEVMEYLTSVMRREKTENIVVTLTKEKSEYIKDENGTPRKQTVKEEVAQIVEIPSRLTDANKAAELIGKRYGIFTEKVNMSGAIPVVISGEDELE